MREEHGAVDPADPREDRAPVGSDACAYTSYEDGEAPDEYPKTGAGTEGVARDVWNALYEVQDPEMPVSVVDLGLIYDVEVEDADGDGAGDGREGTTVTVEMTLTYTGCPARDVLTNDVRCAAETVPEVASAEVDLRYSPEWNVNMVTDRGRADLREFGLSV
ncbi:1,2-phenylacetyl-CoA epoxidase subunit PaaD [Haloparvum sp. PAK95]|uniref:1,2-phenylacetyl-CoA epoxidase subunit PaaD n=1 Tax=Haloparvum sp. PAK95 TaxID=3418962 RepID=UPI003D2F1641